MSDLISRKALINILQEKGDNNIGLLRNNMLFARKLVESVPIAYDVDKVVEWLEDNRQEALCMADESEYFLGQLALLNRVIPLVKGAVKDE